ncbi:hypothetical protein CPB84DRAFT_1827050 [Gymnopilus junonius]|uniref:Uncharacterized protein n=1 Tax=Gymnopilus junonius TaxID=109634 RepID=A0A9P5NHI6_GYMJU|nr:hypothetical protein CPB84DRAFT_1827050 [Gymnopilus junonius]
MDMCSPHLMSKPSRTKKERKSRTTIIFPPLLPLKKSGLHGCGESLLKARKKWDGIEWFRFDRKETSTACTGWSTSTVNVKATAGIPSSPLEGKRAQNRSCSLSWHTERECGTTKRRAVESWMRAMRKIFCTPAGAASFKLRLDSIQHANNAQLSRAFRGLSAAKSPQTSQCKWASRVQEKDSENTRRKGSHGN